MNGDNNQPDLGSLPWYWYLFCWARIYCVLSLSFLSSGQHLGLRTVASGQHSCTWLLSERIPSGTSSLLNTVYQFFSTTLSRLLKTPTTPVAHGVWNPTPWWPVFSLGLLWPSPTNRGAHRPSTPSSHQQFTLLLLPALTSSPLKLLFCWPHLQPRWFPLKVSALCWAQKCLQ